MQPFCFPSFLQVPGYCGFYLLRVAVVIIVVVVVIIIIISLISKMKVGLLLLASSLLEQSLKGTNINNFCMERWGENY
jgi:hypothetical protein